MAITCPSIFGGSPYQPDRSIPLKIGQPLSTLSQRFSIIGSIPRVLNYPGFTLVNCAPVGGFPSNGGIGNLCGFFSGGNWCDDCSVYESHNARLAELCCDSTTSFSVGA